MRVIRGWAGALAGLLSLTGCGILDHHKAIDTATMSVTSTAFRDGAVLPARLICGRLGGQAHTPPLRWSVPSGQIKSYAVVVDDSRSSGGAYVHWVLFNIDPTTTELLENKIPAQAMQARQTDEKTGYAPPCPPKGAAHRYRFTVYALRERVPLPPGAELDDALANIASRTVARGRLIGKFGVT